MYRIHVIQISWVGIDRPVYYFLLIISYIISYEQSYIVHISQYTEQSIYTTVYCKFEVCALRLRGVSRAVHSRDTPRSIFTWGALTGHTKEYYHVGCTHRTHQGVLSRGMHSPDISRKMITLDALTGYI